MTLTIDLTEEEARQLAAKARALGVSLERHAEEVLRRELDHGAPKPVSVTIRELWGDMPPEVRATLPVDGATQGDHYVYGLPKRSQ
jgi:hypothetical protein